MSYFTFYYTSIHSVQGFETGMTLKSGGSARWASTATFDYGTTSTNTRFNALVSLQESTALIGVSSALVLHPHPLSKYLASAPTSPFLSSPTAITFVSHILFLACAGSETRTSLVHYNTHSFGHSFRYMVLHPPSILLES